MSSQRLARSGEVVKGRRVSGTPSLGKSQNRLLDDAALRRRRRMYARRSQSRRWIVKAVEERGDEAWRSRLFDGGKVWDDRGMMVTPRIARCGSPLGELVSVRVSDEAGAHFSGLEHCGSVWACPVCASVIRAGRAQEVEAGFQRSQDLGLGGVMITATVRHSAGMGLSFLLDALTAAWRKLSGQSGFRQMRDRLGYAGMVKSVETTVGIDTGWHPHLHIWWLTDRRLSDLEIQSLRSELAEMWRRAVLRVADTYEIEPDHQHGVTVIRADEAAVADYTVKLQDGGEDTADGSALALELTRGDVKRGRGSARMTPFELLDRGGDGWAYARWIEYVEATKGKRAIVWSPGLRDLLLDGEERTDDEIMDELEDSGDVFGVVEARVWNANRDSPEWITGLLEFAASGDRQRFDLLAQRGARALLEVYDQAR